jgi:uncharacterized phage infection (PIP) family protein YhgE
VDASVRDKAAVEAERLGMSLGDYLTEVVVRSALAEHLNAHVEADPTQQRGEDDLVFTDDGPESYTVRRRLQGLERRVHTSVQGLDSALGDLAARLGDVEGVAADTAAALTHNVAGLRIDLSDVGENLALLAALGEERAAELHEAQEIRSAGLDDRIDIVETVARSAERAGAELGEAHDALTQAVANDFAELASEIDDRVRTSLDDVRATANEAAARADAAVAHLLGDLRAVRESFEARLEDSAADTRAHMHAAFADAAQRMAALAERVGDGERSLHRLNDQFAARVTAVEDAAQTALEDTANVLRQADAELAHRLTRTAQDQATALDAARASLGGEIDAVRQAQLSHLARLDLADSAIGRTINDLAATRDTLTHRINSGETGVRALLERAETEWDVRSANAERETNHLRSTLSAEIERVEACTHAALEKLARDINGNDAALSARLDRIGQDLTDQIAQVRGQAEAEHAVVREDHAGALARITLLDSAVARLESAASPVDARLSRLESALAAIDHTLPGRIAELESHAEQSHALGQRVDAQRALINDASEQVQGLAHALNRVAAQSLEGAAKTEARAHDLEMAVADLRLDRISSADAPASAELMETLTGRIAAIESAQARALETVKADIARFVGDQEARFAAIETPPSQANPDLAAAFDVLRQRVEERILGVEQRSVRMLEQVADTVAMIEQRFVQGEANETASRSA